MTFLSDSNEIAAKLRAQSGKAVFQAPFVLVRREEVQRVTGLSRSSIYGMLDPSSPYYDPLFPAPLRIGARAVAWRADEISAWMQALPRATYGTRLT